MEEMNKVSQQINSISNENIIKLEALFPSVVKDGMVDFDALKEELGDIRETSTEKYELTWAGKKQAKKISLEDVLGKTLKYYPDEGVSSSETENVYIEGDNYEVLKLLRQNYYSAIKMIYIDPPYNTGNDFIYNDSFSISKDESDKLEGAIDELGEKYTANSKSTNRYHANWLSMMYVRLKVARDLLSDEGVIFISIDDNEVDNLKKICTEIFGEENFIGCAGRITKKSNNKGDFWAPNFDYILTFAKNKDMAEPFLGEANVSAYNLVDEEGPRAGEKYQLVRLYMSSLQNRNPDQRFWIECPDGSKIIPPGRTFPPERPALGDGIWRWSKPTYEANIDKIVIKQVKSSNLIDENGNPAKWNVFTKTYLNDVIEKASAKPNSFIEDHINQNASHELNELDIPFDYAKPTSLIKYLMTIARVKDDDIVMDFFSGSASTADAVMQLNSEDGNKRRFVLVQLPEAIDEKTEAYKKGYRYITDIGKERIRRRGVKIKQDNPDSKVDIGFRVFKVGETNIKWNSLMSAGQLNLAQIESTPDMADFMPGTNDIDVVYEIMLRQRDVPLSENIEKLTDIGERTYLYADAYLICLETEITTMMIDKLAEIDPVPVKFIFRDSAFKDDIALKDETFRRLKAVVERNSGDVKTTYTVEFI